jgi:hypothetical protein
MSAENRLLTKYVKKKFPFIKEISDFYLQKNKLFIHAVVSPQHFCELFIHDDVNKKINNMIEKEFTSMIKSIITEWDENDIQFIYFPELNEEQSILTVLEVK